MFADASMENDWTDVVNGLSVLGGWEQELRPWDANIQVGRLVFSVQKGILATTGTESDAFAEKVFAGGGGVETYLAAPALDCNDTTVTVNSTSAFASSGSIHIGTERINYTGKTATTFTGCTRGMSSPFKANTEASQRFGQPHRLASVGDNVVIQPKVTSVQRDWRGRRVGLWMISYGTTSWSDAQLVWAGRIENPRDGTNGATYLECVDIKAQLRECELMRHQFEGRIQEGIYLQAGWKFDALDEEAGVVLHANALTVVDSTPGTNEILKGVYKLDELMSALNDWLSDEFSAGTPRLNHKYTFGIADDSSGVRTKLALSSGSSSGNNRSLLSVPALVSEFLGFTLEGSGAGAVSWTPGGVGLRFDWNQAASASFLSPEEPYRSIVAGTVDDLFTITVENIRGDRFNARTHLPNLGVQLDSGSEWGVFQIGGSNGPIALFELVSESSAQVVLRGGVANETLDRISGTPWGGAPLLPWTKQYRKVRYSEEENLDIRQVGLVGGQLATVINRLVSSTGTDGYNHATYDKLPQQLGAGVPWELLGTNWTSTVNALSTGTGYPITLYIPKPTKLMSVIGPELVARVAQIVWKNEGLRIASWGTPTAARSLHSFTEANKATPHDTKDAQRAPAVLSDEFLVNRVRMKFGRGDWAQEWTIVDPASQDTYGQFGKEIDLPSVSHVPLMEAVEGTLETMVPFFSRPMHVLQRSINPAFYENCAPGDFCTVTDNFARNPSTGSRGLSSKPGLIIKHSIDWGGFDDTGKSRAPNGTVEILLLPLSNIATYSPCAEVDNTAANGGYDAGNKRLTIKAHEHSESSEAADASRFPVGSQTRIVEIDPSNPASPLTWDTFVIAQSGNTIDLNDALTGWDATKRYRVISDLYANSDANLQQIHVYQADSGDALIQDTVGAYVYGTDITQAGTWTDDAGTEQVALYSTYGYGDGAPLDTGYEKDLARLANNMVNYRTARVAAPYLHRTVINDASFSGGGTTKAIIAVYPANFQPGALMLGDRLIYARPWFRSNDGTSVTLTVSLCATPPTGTSFENGDVDAPQYSLGAVYESKTWTTTSTTWAVGSQQSFSGKSVNQVTGEVYVVLETNSTKLETRGLPLLWQDNFDEAA